MATEKAVRGCGSQGHGHQQGCAGVSTAPGGEREAAGWPCWSGALTEGSWGVGCSGAESRPWAAEVAGWGFPWLFSVGSRTGGQFSVVKEVLAVQGPMSTGMCFTSLDCCWHPLSLTSRRWAILKIRGCPGQWLQVMGQTSVIACGLAIVGLCILWPLGGSGMTAVVHTS